MITEYSTGKKYWVLFIIILGILFSYIFRSKPYICIVYGNVFSGQHMNREFPELYIAIEAKLDNQREWSPNGYSYRHYTFQYPKPFWRIMRIGWILKFAWQWSF